MGRSAADRTPWVDLLVVLAAAPFFIFPQALITPLLMGGLLLWLLLRGRRWTADSWGTPLNVPLLGVAVMLLVGLGATYDLALSFPKASGVYYGLLLCLTLTHALRTPRALHLAVGGLLGGGVAVALLSLVGTRWSVRKMPLTRRLVALYQQLPTLVRGLPRAPEGFNPNVVGGTLTLFVPLAVVLLVYVAARRRGRPGRTRLLSAALLLALLLLGATLLLTQSRLAYLATGVTLLLLGLSERGVVRWVALGVLLVGLGALVVLGPNTVAYGLFGVPTLAAWSRYGVLSGRQEIWHRALAVLRDHPLTGIGFSTLVPIVHARYPTFHLTPDKDFTHAHNLYLQTALDLGIPGLIAFLALLIVLSILLVRVQRHAARPFHRALAKGLRFGMTAQLLYGLADAIALGQKSGVFFWSYLGVGAALWLQTRRANDDETPLSA